MGIVLILLSLTESQDNSERLKAIRTSFISVAIILTLACFTGESISKFVVYSNKTSVFYDKLIIILSGIIVAFIVWVSLRLADYLRNFLSQTGLNIFRRIMGLILASISVEFIGGGLLKLFFRPMVKKFVIKS